MFKKKKVNSLNNIIAFYKKKATTREDNCLFLYNGERPNTIVSLIFLL
jgi:hypothetical protein